MFITQNCMGQMLKRKKVFDSPNLQPFVSLFLRNCAVENRQNAKITHKQLSNS